MALDRLTKFGLNNQQLEAVRAPLGPVLILAGAGSGKTRALTTRIVFLIEKLGFKPHQILAVTFTNKAAGELKQRVLKLLGRSPENLPHSGTFHSIGARILRTEASRIGLSRNFIIYDEDDQESLIKDLMINLRIDSTKFKPSLFANIIDRAKNNLEQPDQIEVGSASGGKKFNALAKKIYEAYQTQLKQNNAVDFGDLIMLPVVLFQTQPEVLNKYQNLWQYVLVDEYQDTNHAQYVLTKLLTAAHQNLFVVGDDAQAIYGFRGANLQNILDFEKDYPAAKVVRLEQNYRSTAPILAVAEKIIALSPQQFTKKLWTQNKQGLTPVLYEAEDEMAEAYFVAAKIIELQDGRSNELEYLEDEDDSILSRVMHHSRFRALPKLKNRKGLNEIVVLYRTHAQSRAVEQAMIESNIPYQIVGGLKFYERREVKDILSYLRLLVSPNDLISLKRVINVPTRGIGDKTFDLLKAALLSKQEKNLAKLFAGKPAVKNFFEALDSLSKLDEKANLLDVLRQLLKLTGYEKYIRDGSDEGESRWENVLELFNVAGAFRHLPWREGLIQFLEEVALMTSVDELDRNSPKVTLMTLHQAKGLEFETVFLIGLEEGLLPHARSLLEPKDIAEEIRLAYVGVTRAKKQLFLVYAQSRKQYGSRVASIRSRILRAIPEELLEVYEQTY